MLFLSFSGPASSSRYDPCSLSAADRRRAGESRAARAELDWRVSRVLAAELRMRAGAAQDAEVALSHSRGHALAGLAPVGWKLAVDLERCRMRDVSGLAEWVCDAAEGSLLASEAGQARLRAFHLLWTLKEAMLKALDLPFPAGMRRVGLAVNGDGGMKLRAPSGQWRAQAWELPDQWIAAAAWSASAEGAPRELSTCWIDPVGAESLGCWESA